MEFEVFNQSTRVSDRANFPERSPQAPTSPIGGVECEEGPGAATVRHEDLGHCPCLAPGVQAALPNTTLQQRVPTQ